jgi:hypothetical protein
MAGDIGNSKRITFYCSDMSYISISKKSSAVKKAIRPFVVSLSLFFSVELIAQQTDPDFHIYILVGQSNMAGRGAVDSISKLTDPRIVMLDRNGEWVPATDPLHFDKPDIVGVGPGLAFAKEMLAGNNKNVRIGLVPCAWGGSPVRVWEPDSAYLTGHPYDDAIRRGKIAMRSGVIKGIIWHQGEADNNASGIQQYTNKIRVLIERFRKEFNAPNLPFVAGEIGRFGKPTPINKVLDELPAHIPYTLTVSSEGLKDKGDKTHFDTPSARELGKRYAIAMKRLLTK